MLSLPANPRSRLTLRISIFAFAFALLFVVPLSLPKGNLLLCPPPALASSNAYLHGKELFATKGCAHCHGAEGINGDQGPDLQQIRKRMSVVQVATQIRDGSKSMPAFADSLSAPEIDDLVIYLRTKRKKIVKPPPPPPAPPAPKPDPD
ncbi:c-type cytochrome [Granulicella paludicola]|uniref:c-type cytochrome n=1 Tax=Granulicella paludicola TaxID=474951 RepID=UPI0021E0E413|nr:cytochrome c [Granulicella paludicola]